MPDYSWYKSDEFLTIKGTITKTDTVIESHNLTEEELLEEPDLSNFKIQDKKELSLGKLNMNIHPINDNKNTISGHVSSFSDVLIKYNDVNEIVASSSEGLFSYDLLSSLPIGTEVLITTNVSGSFLYETRKVIVPYEGEISLLEAETFFDFSFAKINNNSLIFGKNKEFVLKVVDSRTNSSNWKLLAKIEEPLTSQNGYVLEDALVFKKFDDNIITLDEIDQVVYEGSNNLGNVKYDVITWSKEKGPLLDLTNNYLEVNEEYFSNICFTLEE